jgi:hypothetical protein
LGPQKKKGLFWEGAQQVGRGGGLVGEERERKKMAGKTQVHEKKGMGY